MDRNELHQQILELADKIGHLNDTLSRSKRIHPVEIDLLRLYVRELVSGTEELAEMTGMQREAFAAQKNTTAVPAANEPMVLEELSAPQRTVEAAKPQAPVTEIATPPPAPEPLVEKNTEPGPAAVVEKAPEPEPTPVAEKIASPAPTPIADIVPPQPTPEAVLPAPKPELEVSPKVEAPIFEPVASIHQEKTPEPTATEKETAAPVMEEPATPPLRRQVNIQPDAAGSDSSFVKPVAGVATKHVLHSMGEEELDAPSINDRFTQQSDLFHHARRADAKGLKEMMDLGERFLFMKELFNGDSAAFDRATDAINGIMSMEQAKAYIEAVLRQKYDWEGKEPVVRQFNSLVEQLYKS